VSLVVADFLQWASGEPAFIVLIMPHRVFFNAHVFESSFFQGEDYRHIRDFAHKPFEKSNIIVLNGGFGFWRIQNKRLLSQKVYYKTDIGNWFIEAYAYVLYHLLRIILGNVNVKVARVRGLNH